jgi:ribosomal protein S18 acetylase RimI-like enzyme
MPLVYRPALAQDLATAEALVIASINDLTERHGFGPMATASPPNFQMFSLKDDPGGLWVAEDGGDILGFAWSWVCGDVWFLAQLFVDPNQQGRGIGNELIKLTLEHARKSRAAHKALITFTFNRVSQGLYMRHGLFPKMPIYFFGAARERVLSGLPDAPLSRLVIEDTAAHMKALAEIDARTITPLMFKGVKNRGLSIAKTTTTTISEATAAAESAAKICLPMRLMRFSQPAMRARTSSSLVS